MQKLVHSVLKKIVRNKFLGGVTPQAFGRVATVRWSRRLW